jgi:hypothetical protein
VGFGCPDFFAGKFCYAGGVFVIKNVVILLARFCNKKQVLGIALLGLEFNLV